MNSPRVCICMATHNPPERLFARQIESIRVQTHNHWTCLINDDASRGEKVAFIQHVIAGDPRFVLERNPRTLGFYLNFERVLRRVPVDCPLVSLADQDDHWYPHKLAALAAALRDPAAQLAFADMRIVDERLRPIPEAAGAARRSGPPDLESLFFTNTVTGAASMFRAALLPAILPFPTPRGMAFHDWWIALVALAAGGIRYIDEPLHDYCQHGANALGWRRRRPELSLGALFLSARYRERVLAFAQRVYAEDCPYLAEAAGALFERVTPTPALRRLHVLRERPMRMLIGQLARSMLAGSGTYRKRQLILAHALGRRIRVAKTMQPDMA